MKVVILAGGFGTRIAEESHLKPKPMIEIGGMPILWHIMKIYSSWGFNDFIICCGYKQQVIKEFFANYYLHRSDVTFDFRDQSHMEVHSTVSEPWRVTVVDTGLTTMTGGRIKRIQPYVGDEAFCLTYGDGVSDVNMKKLVEFHQSHGKIATLTAINAGQRFGVINADEQGMINRFREKKDSDGTLINGGFMVLNPAIFSYLQNDQTVFEQGPLEQLVKEGQLMAYRHEGFWQCMDTQRDKEKLETMWAAGDAPWKIW
ncbi:MAG: glucose-1-phosphate cytidylyltransferase [Clostridia bacterium]|nr:glucose-1-phosphate cytidylyltransferase [Clostridia bacterium]